MAHPNKTAGHVPAVFVSPRPRADALPSRQTTGFFISRLAKPPSAWRCAKSGSAGSDTLYRRLSANARHLHPAAGRLQFSWVCNADAPTCGDPACRPYVSEYPNSQFRYRANCAAHPAQPVLLRTVQQGCSDQARKQPHRVSSNLRRSALSALRALISRTLKAPSSSSSIV